MWIELVQTSGQICRAYAIWHQISQNRLSKSVEGLSYDFVVLNLACHFFTVSATLVYFGCRQSFAERYPLAASDFAVSVPLFCTDLLSFCLGTNLLHQVATRYRRTANEYQGFSATVIVLVCVFLFFDFYVFLCLNRVFYGGGSGTVGNFGFFKLDLADFAMIQASVCSFCQFFPQITLNFTSFSYRGLSLKSLRVQIAGEICTISTIFLSNSPLNGKNAFVAGVNLLNCAILYYQSTIYRSTKKAIHSTRAQTV